MIIVRKKNCRAFGYNIGHPVPAFAEPWSDTQVVGGRMFQHAPGTLAVRKPSSAGPAVWTDPKRRLVCSPPGPSVFGAPSGNASNSPHGSCWLNADANGNPTHPSQVCADLPDKFPDADPLNPDDPDASGVSSIRIIWVNRIIALAAQNVVLSKDGDDLYFDTSNAHSRWFAATTWTTTPANATPPERPFRFPAGAPAGSPDRSVLADISRRLPYPPELKIPNVSGYPIHSVRGLNLGGKDWYDVGLMHQRGDYPLFGNPSPIVIPSPPIAVDSRHYAHLQAGDTGSQGLWTGESIGLCEPGTGQITYLEADATKDANCAGSVINWSAYPALEERVGWTETSSALLPSVVSTRGLPSRLFASVAQQSPLPNEGTAFDLLLCFAEYNWMPVQATRNVIDRDIELMHGGQCVRVVHVESAYYTLANGDASSWNTWIWGQFIQIVPVVPKSIS